MRASHRRLDDVDAGMDAAGDRERRLDASGERRSAAQAERQLRGIRQRQRPDDLELLDVDVGPMKAREEDEPVGAVRVELMGEVRERREEWRQLDGHRNPARLRFTSRTDVDGLPLDLGGAHRHVAGGVIQVQLERIGAGLLEQLRDRRSSRPRVTPLSDAITGMPNRLFDPAQVLEILVGPQATSRDSASNEPASLKDSSWLRG